MFGGRGHRSRLSDSLAVPKAFVVTKQEELVFTNRTASGRAELVLLERLCLVGEIVSGIEDVVAVFRQTPKKDSPGTRIDDAALDDELHETDDLEED